MPPKATNRPTPIAVTEEPGVPSGFIIPMLRKLSFSVNILYYKLLCVQNIELSQEGLGAHHILWEMGKSISNPERMMTRRDIHNLKY
jgi:hypothetical protein